MPGPRLPDAKVRRGVAFAAITALVIGGTFTCARLTQSVPPPTDQAGIAESPSPELPTAIPGSPIPTPTPGSVYPTVVTPPPVLPTPTVMATAFSADGLPREVFLIPVADPQYYGHARTYGMGVRRGDQTFLLEATHNPRGFGCEVEGTPFDTFGCYFGSGWFEYLDEDQEPEVVTAWEHDGTGGYASFHVYRWDGSSYPLLGVFMEPGLRSEIADLNDDGVRDIILRYNVGLHQAPLPWVDIYTLAGGVLVNVNEHYPEFYQHLLETYEEMRPGLAQWEEGLAELDRWVEKAKEFAYPAD